MCVCVCVCVWLSIRFQVRPRSSSSGHSRLICFSILIVKWLKRAAFDLKWY